MEYLKGFYGDIQYKMKFDESISKMIAFGEYFIKDFPFHYLNEIKKICEEVNFGQFVKVSLDKAKKIIYTEFSFSENIFSKEAQYVHRS